MKSIQIQNLRSLQNTGKIILRPITILVGENSSGKSTFLRTFPLFRQGFEQNSTGPILWYGKYVDFGSFDDSVNVFSEEKSISFNFEFGEIDISEMTNIFGEEPTFEKPVFLQIGFKISKVKGKEEFVSDIRSVFADNTFCFEINKDRKFAKFQINDNDFTFEASNLYARHIVGVLPRFILEAYDRTTHKKIKTTNFNVRFYNLFSKYFPGFPESKIGPSIIRRIFLGSSEDILLRIKNIVIEECPEEYKRLADWSISTQEFIELRDLALAAQLPGLLFYFNSALFDFSKNVRYIAPLRATAERYYRIQNLSVGEIDFQGQNLATILNNLSKNDLRNLSKWLGENFDFELQPSSSKGHTSINLVQGKMGFNLADVGFGYSQLLPILIQLWKSSLGSQRFRKKNNSTIIAIEQPELHIHPRLQGKLAIAFTKIINEAKKNENNIQLVIETHSEKLINTFGRLVADGVLDKGDINIILFEKPHAEIPSSIRISCFDSEGFLQNWPFGFFEPELD